MNSMNSRFDGKVGGNDSIDLASRLASTIRPSSLNVT